MLRKCLILAALVAGVTLAACGSGPSDPMPGEDMPMQVTAADSLTS